MLRKGISLLLELVMMTVILQIAASNTTISQIVDLFGLHFDILSMDARWMLTEDSINRAKSQ